MEMLWESGAAHGIRTHTFYLLRVATPASWSRAALKRIGNG